MTAPNSATESLKLGISACLLGDQVRYNGGHKQSTLCSKVLSEHFEFVPVCPEVAIGLGTPREPIRLIGDPEAPRVAFVTQEPHHQTQAPNSGKAFGLRDEDFSPTHYFIISKYF